MDAITVTGTLDDAALMRDLEKLRQNVGGGASRATFGCATWSRTSARTRYERRKTER